ncbi:MAG TPA: STAS domain-containing protein [Patescibacteria group bacterium]|nr:STAS domain-containing protein [Patescibacteria group bacterium]
MSLSCKVRRVGDVSILDLKGEITLVLRGDDSVQLLEVVRNLTGEGSKYILLNLAGVTRMDSAGIGQLIATHTSTRSRGAQLKLLKPMPEVRKLLEMTQLVKVLEVHDDEERAIRSFSASHAA